MPEKIPPITMDTSQHSWNGRTKTRLYFFLSYFFNLYFPPLVFPRGKVKSWKQVLPLNSLIIYLSRGATDMPVSWTVSKATSTGGGGQVTSPLWHLWAHRGQNSPGRSWQQCPSTSTRKHVFLVCSNWQSSWWQQTLCCPNPFWTIWVKLSIRITTCVQHPPFILRPPL